MLQKAELKTTVNILFIQKLGTGTDLKLLCYTYEIAV